MPIAMHIGWGISPGITATAFDLLDQAPTLSADELALWFGLTSEQATVIQARWHDGITRAGWWHDAAEARA